MQNEELYHKPKRGTENVLKKVVLSKDKVRIIQACHDNPLSGGQFGRDKTFTKKSQNYYCEGMKDDVSKYISKWTLLGHSQDLQMQISIFVV